MAPLFPLHTATHLIRTYLTALPRIAYRASASLLVDPRGAQTFVHQVLNAVDLESDDPVLTSVSIEEVIPGGGDVSIVGRYYSQRNGGTQLLLEIASLAYLVKRLDPKLVFEIGTFVGRTTRLMAANCGLDCRVITLDLHPDSVSHKVGQDFHDTPESSRIKQFHGDSRSFDFDPWIGKCDFVWVDACHDYEFVVSDTENALKLTRPGGWIGWHDYRHSAWWSGVTRCVRELRMKYSDIVHLRGTTTALLQKPLAEI